MRARKKISDRVKKQTANENFQAANNKLSTDEKVEQRRKDYRNNKTSPYQGIKNELIQRKWWC